MSLDSNDTETQRPSWATEAEEEAAYDAWLKVRENPENLQYGTNDLDVAELPYYRLNPPEEEFCDGYFSVSVGLCGYHGRYPITLRDLHPDTYAEHVLLGINGTSGTRLANVLLEPDEALQLAKLLKKAAKKVEDR
jgi:hypothetical protein